MEIWALIHLSYAIDGSPVARVKLKEVYGGISALVFVVVVGAVRLLTFPARRSAFHGLIIEVVVLLLFPAVAVPAAVLKTAAIRVGAGFFLFTPGSALVL